MVKDLDRKQLIFFFFSDQNYIDIVYNNGTLKSEELYVKNNLRSTGVSSSLSTW
jgi:hypothetical protein